MQLLHNNHEQIKRMRKQCVPGVLSPSLVSRPHPSAREKGLVKNDTILGPLRHSGYVTTMLIANQLGGLWFTYDHMLDMADQVPCVFCRKNTAPKDQVLFGQSPAKVHAFTHVRKNPCFARLSQGSNKLDAVTSIVYDWAL